MPCLISNIIIFAVQWLGMATLSHGYRTSAQGQKIGNWKTRTIDLVKESKLLKAQKARLAGARWLEREEALAKAEPFAEEASTLSVVDTKLNQDDDAAYGRMRERIDAMNAIRQEEWALEQAASQGHCGDGCGVHSDEL